jgi:hypothetical protein
MRAPKLFRVQNTRNKRRIPRLIGGKGLTIEIRKVTIKPVKTLKIRRKVQKMFNNNEINVTLTPYQIDYLIQLIDDKLHAGTGNWNREMVMQEGLIEYFEGLLTGLRAAETID